MYIQTTVQTDLDVNTREIYEGDLHVCNRDLLTNEFYRRELRPIFTQKRSTCIHTKATKETHSFLARGTTENETRKTDLIFTNNNCNRDLHAYSQDLERDSFKCGRRDCRLTVVTP